MKDYIRRFIGFENLKDYVPLEPAVSPQPVKQQDEMLSVIYAPDPVTGLPSSDIGMLLKNKDNPEVQRYIQQRLQIHHGSVAGIDNPDDALDAIRQYREDVVSYANRIREKYSSKPDVQEKGED